MKSFILQIFNRLGYVLMRNKEWQEVQNRLHTMTTILSAERTESKRVLEAEASAIRLQLADSQHLLAECRMQLAKCMSERDTLSNKIGRANIAVETLQRAQKSLQSLADESRAQLARIDVSGRITELEREKVRLTQRISDLETYLKETRGPENPYL